MQAATIPSDPLVQRAQAGDNAAFDRLMIVHRRRLSRVIARVLHDPNDVEDAVQESFLRAYKGLPQFRGDAKFSTWLHRIGMNTANSMVKRRYGRAKRLTAKARYVTMPTEYDEAETPETLFESKRMVLLLETSIERLPEGMREAVILRELECCSYREVAERLACPINTVRSRLFRARRIIRDDLEYKTHTTNQRRAA